MLIPFPLIQPLQIPHTIALVVAHTEFIAIATIDVVNNILLRYVPADKPLQHIIGIVCTIYTTVTGHPSVDTIFDTVPKIYSQKVSLRTRVDT